MMTHSEFQLEWFCVRTRQKHERIAASQLRQCEGVETVNPVLRFRKSIRHKRTLVTEPLFPNYIFARFVLREKLDEVRYTQGVSTVVQFGRKYPVISDMEITALKEQFGGAGIREFDGLERGEEVRIVGKAFVGLRGVVNEYMPARQRVSVLVDLLGRTTLVELNLDSVVSDVHPRESLVGI